MGDESERLAFIAGFKVEHGVPFDGDLDEFLGEGWNAEAERKWLEYERTKPMPREAIPTRRDRLEQRLNQIEAGIAELKAEQQSADRVKTALRRAGIFRR